ncbi:MAG: alpha-glucosidase C-terminal domain-containing protein [Bacteroidales bacterium]|nr:alpha-glucosidase C-terminal domain-containing protein [Bacteroidales bacterium]
MKNKIFSIISPAVIIMLLLAVPAAAQSTKNSEMTKKHPVISMVKHPDWSIKANIYEVNIRQFSPEGTFDAFAKHLPALKKMGVKILWLMPVNPIGKKNRKGPLGSYYSVQNYEKVNPNFGTLEDLKELVKEAHKMGMHVILDWVANHTSWDNPWATEHPDWYKRDKKGNFVSPFDWTDVIQLNYDNQDLRKAMIHAMEYWVKNADIDGFRCDVAGMVPVSFWDEARASLDKIKPVFMLAEDEDNTALMKKAFDMNYAWKMLHVMNEVAKGKQNAADVWNYFGWEDETFGPGVYRMYFTSNHDENSWNGTAFDRLGKAFKMFTVFDYTVPGMPLIYNGEEAGSNKALKFFEKDTINWSKDTYVDFYTRLNELKKDNHALWNGLEGGKLIPLSKENKNVFAFYRKKRSNQVVVVLNMSDTEQVLNWNNVDIMGHYKNAFTGEKTELHGEGTFHLKPWDYIVLIK